MCNNGQLTLHSFCPAFSRSLIV